MLNVCIRIQTIYQTDATFLLLLWKWINVSSIAIFSRKTPGMFSRVKKYVMYDLLKRENINWRVLNLNYYI